MRGVAGVCGEGFGEDRQLRASTLATQPESLLKLPSRPQDLKTLYLRMVIILIPKVMKGLVRLEAVSHITCSQIL